MRAVRGYSRFCIKEAGFAMVSVTLEVKAVLTMKLQISYDPESDTLDIGNGLPGNDGQVVADRLTAFFGDGEDTVGVTLENAVELLAPCLRDSVSEPADVSRQVTTDTDLEIYYFPQTDTLDLGNGLPANDGYDIAENLIAHANDDGEVVGITLEHAAEVLIPYLRKHMTTRA